MDAGQSSTTTTTAQGPASTPATPTPKEASKLIAGLSDTAIDDHLAKDSRGEFTAPKPKAEPEAKKPEAGKGKAEDTPPDAMDAETAKREARIAEQTKMIGRQSTEIGNLRSQVEKLTAMIDELKGGAKKQGDGDSPDFFADPEGSVKKILTKAEQEKAEREAASLRQRRETASQVMTSYPDIEHLMPEMIKIAQADGVPDEALDAFARDPFGESPHAIMSLAHRAKLQIEMRTLRNHNSNTTAAQKQPDAKPAPIPTPGINGSMGRSGSPVGAGMVSRQQIANMSDTELAELMSKGG